MRPLITFNNERISFPTGIFWCPPPPPAFYQLYFSPKKFNLCQKIQLKKKPRPTKNSKKFYVRIVFFWKRTPLSKQYFKNTVGETFDQVSCRSYKTRLFRFSPVNCQSCAWCIQVSSCCWGRFTWIHPHPPQPHPNFRFFPTSDFFS